MRNVISEEIRQKSTSEEYVKTHGEVYTETPQIIPQENYSFRGVQRLRGGNTQLRGS
jgi:hypothetical protein